MMKLVVGLATCCLLMPAPSLAQGAPEATDPAAQAPEASAQPPRDQATSARETVEAQLRQPPRQQHRVLSRQERERLTERYLEAIGKPVERAATATRGPR